MPDGGQPTVACSPGSRAVIGVFRPGRHLPANVDVELDDGPDGPIDHLELHGLTVTTPGR